MLPAIPSARPESSCPPASCMRLAPIDRAIPISRSCSSSAVVIPTVTIAAHASIPMIVPIQVASRVATRCRSMPVRTRSAGSSSSESRSTLCRAAHQAVTSVPSFRRIASVVMRPVRLIASSSVGSERYASGRCSAPRDGRLYTPTTRSSIGAPKRCTRSMSPVFARKASAVAGSMTSSPSRSMRRPSRISSSLND